MHDHTLFVWYSGVRLQVKEEYKMLLEKKKDYHFIGNKVRTETYSSVATVSLKKGT